MRTDRKNAARSASKDPVETLIQDWIAIRQARGMTREAAIAELNTAASVVAGMKLAENGE